MKYKKLAEVYSSLESTSKRLEKIDILSDFLKQLKKEDKEVLYLLLGDIYPSYDERKIGISNQLVIKSLTKALGIEKDKVVKEWKEIGDLGKVAEKLTKNKKQKTLHATKDLETQKILENLRKLPELEGKGTINKKISLISELLAPASSLETLYLVRTLIGDLRIGVQENTVRDAIIEAFFKKEKEKANEKVQKAIDRSNDIAKVFEIAKQKDLKKLDKVHLEVGKPVKAMLAQKVETIEDGFKALGKPLAVEYKYDGFRLIIHKDKNKIKLFTRRLEEVTNQFPEVQEYVNKYVKGESFILDSEAVGYDKKTKKYLPFQSVSQRIKRKYNIDKLKDELPIEVNVFDILYYNGKSLMDKPFKKRTELLHKIIDKKKYKIVVSKQIVTSDVKKAKDFYKKAIKDNQEGVMLKNLNAVYKPGRRVGNLLKIKPEERDYDLVITGAEYGTGKRKGWLSSFILSCKGNKNSEYLEVGKMSTGLKEKPKAEKTKEEEDEMTFEELTEKLKPYFIKEKGKDVKIKPKIVVSVTYQEIQRSPTYESGFALRFPRFTALREDKPLGEITTLEEIKKDYEAQKRNWQYG